MIAMTTSSGCTSCTGRVCATLATRLRWVSITPLGLPVVPELYGSTARCVAGSKLTCGGVEPASRSSAALGWPSVAAPGAVEHHQLVVGHADRRGGLLGLRQ